VYDHHAATAAWPSTVAIFCQPSILRNLFFVESLNHVRGTERLPLGLGETKEREKFVAAFPQARHRARHRLAHVRSKAA
jgi:hypothetical protein